MVLDPTSAQLSAHSLRMKMMGSEHHSRPPLALISSSDACMSIVHNLMCHRQGGESEEFSKFAIESLIKKLKDRRDELDALIIAVSSCGAHPTGCITIQRTLDSRMQIAGRKVFPHIIYARLWRWPDVHKTELRHLHYCEFGFDKKLDWVCVNPYHYQRIISSSLDIESLVLTSIEKKQQDYHNESEDSETEHVDTPKDCLHQKHQHNSNSNLLNGDMELYNGIEQSISSTIIPLRLSVKSILDESTPYSSPQLKPETCIKHSTLTYEPSQNIGMGQPDLANIMQWMNSNNTSNTSTIPTLSTPDHTSLDQEEENDILEEEGLKHEEELEKLPGSIGWNAHSSSVALDAAETAALLDPVSASGGAFQCSGASTGGLPSSNSGGGIRSSMTGGGFGGGGVGGSYNRQMGGGWGQGGNSQQPPIPPMIPNQGLQPPILTSQRPPQYWCHIAYFELDEQVGELFKVPSHYSRVVVDGYTDPSSRNRFCLGQLSNVHRSEQSEKSRLYIGKGVELDNVGEGDVWIRCLSEFSIFVQSYYLDREAGRAPGDAVHKIYPGAYIKVFDIRQCHEQMCNLARMAQDAAVRQANAVAGSSSSVPPSATGGVFGDSSTGTAGGFTSIGEAAGVGVDDLRRLCNLRLSFVKGWGPDYPRHDIKETPCWIEIQLHRPLQLLDEVLQSMPLNDLKPTRHFFYYQNQTQKR